MSISIFAPVMVTICTRSVYLAGNWCSQIRIQCCSVCWLSIFTRLKTFINPPLTTNNGPLWGVMVESHFWHSAQHCSCKRLHPARADPLVGGTLAFELNFTKNRLTLVSDCNTIFSKSSSGCHVVFSTISKKTLHIPCNARPY